jgi:hypothetical protein
MTRTATKRRPAARATARRAPHRPTHAPALRELWLAGLGTAAAAGEAADGLVDRLVAKGRETEPRVRARAGRAAATLKREAGRVAATIADELGTRAKSAVEGAFDRLGVAPKKRAKNILHRLGDLADAIL